MGPIPSNSTLSSAIRAFTRLSYAHILKANLNDTPNLFYSPTSIAMALIALHVGSNAHTARNIEKLLGLTEADVKKLHDDTHKFLLSLEHRDENEQSTSNKHAKDTKDTKNTKDTKDAKPAALKIANALAVQKDFAVEHAFIATLRNQLGSDIMSVDFVGNPELARRDLNTWVAEHTGQKITDLLPPNVFDPLTRLTILNAVYFEGHWSTAFDKAKTQEAKFWPISGNSSIPVQMMSQTKAKLWHWSNSDDYSGGLYSDVVKFGVVSLPYEKAGVESLEMLVVLPDERDGLKKLDKLLIDKPEALDEILTAFSRNFRKRDVNIRLPRFSLSENLRLSELLKQLDVKVFEDDAPDFTGISEKDGKNLYVKKALHKAVVDVDEEGTRAAAATAVVMNLRCARIEEPAVDFVVDHACLFLLYASDASIPLFIGRLAEPKSQ